MAAGPPLRPLRCAVVILLTGATGPVGRALLPRLAAAGHPVRCLVRDPRALGPDRVSVQVALGDLARPASFRRALRGVRTVVHLAAATRDRGPDSLETLNAVATHGLVRAAERAGAERFVFLSILGAAPHAPARFLRARALAERAVMAGRVEPVVLAPSLIVAPGHSWMKALDRLSWLPVVPLPGRDSARFQPIAADDVAAAVVAAIGGAGPIAGRRLELAGPDTVSLRELARAVLRALGRPRPLLPVPPAAGRTALAIVEAAVGGQAFATWSEAQLLLRSMVSERGTADAQALGVSPRPLSAVLPPRQPAT